MAGVTTKPKLALRDTLAAVLAHPVRVRCFVAFNERTTSSIQLVRAWGLSEEQHWRVSHHVMFLAELGIIEEVCSRPVRGGRERFYRATRRPIMYDEDFAKLTYEERDSFTRYVLQLVVTDATLAIDQKVFNQRTNRTLIRLPMVVDEQGFKDLRIEEELTYERRLKIATESAARNAQRKSCGEEPIEINIRSVTGFHEAGRGGGALADPPPETAALELATETKRNVAPPMSLEVTLAAVLEHPVRVRCLVALSEGIVSPAQLARAWGLSNVKLVSPHVERLESLGLVEQVWERKVRGGRERFYRAIAVPILYSKEFAKLTDEERDSFTRYVLQLIVIDAALAVEQRVFDRRPNRALIRMPMNVDDEGFNEMAAEEKDGMKRRLEIRSESSSRIEAARNRGTIPLEINIRSFTSFHEAASGGGALADPPPELVELESRRFD